MTARRSKRARLLAQRAVGSPRRPSFAILPAHCEQLRRYVAILLAKGERFGA